MRIVALNVGKQRRIDIGSLWKFSGGIAPDLQLGALLPARLDQIEYPPLGVARDQRAKGGGRIHRISRPIGRRASFDEALNEVIVKRSRNQQSRVGVADFTLVGVDAIVGSLNGTIQIGQVGQEYLR